jgi:hypothetical protein
MQRLHYTGLRLALLEGTGPYIGSPDGGNMAKFMAMRLRQAGAFIVFLEKFDHGHVVQLLELQHRNELGVDPKKSAKCGL